MENLKRKKEQEKFEEKLRRQQKLIEIQFENLKRIKQEQEKHKKEINDLVAKKEELTQMLQNLEKDVESYNIYKKFIEQVNAKYSNDTTNQNDLYDNLKEKFEQLMNHEIEIQKNIDFNYTFELTDKEEYEINNTSNKIIAILYPNNSTSLSF